MIKIINIDLYPKSTDLSWTNILNNPLPDGLIAQLVEHDYGITEVQAFSTA